MEEIQRGKKIAVTGIALAAGLILIFIALRSLGWYYREQGVKKFQAGDYAAAKSFLLRSLRFDPRRPTPHFYLGKIALGRPKNPQDTGKFYPNADYREAVYNYEKALALGIERISSDLRLWALQNSALSYLELAEYDKAEQTLKEAINDYPDKTFLPRYWLASLYFNRLDRPKEALDVILPAPNSATLELYRDNLFNIYTLSARLYTYFDDFANTANYAKLAISNVPASVKNDMDVQIAHILLANIYVQQGDLKQAETEIDKARELAGSSDAHPCYLARMYLRGRKYSKAIEIARSAVQKPERPSGYTVCIETLGESYLARDMRAEAKKYLTEYLAIADGLDAKNIFVQRNIRNFKQLLQGL